jgi:hypothetical protein
MNIAVIICAFIIINRIYHFLRKQSNREKNFWWEQKHLRGGKHCRLYTAAKALLLLIAIAGLLLILISLAYGQTPRLHDLTNPKFQTALLGAAVLLLLQLLPLAIIHLIKRAAKPNFGKIILFFTIITGIAAILLTGICLVAF